MDRPSITETYARATRSSHLEVKMSGCDIDYIIAAGWVRDGLGPQMMRLRIEYDAARGALPKASARGWVDRAIVAAGLRSMTAASRALQAYAQVFAARAGFMAHAQERRHHEVADVAVRVLHAWLDPACPHCAGRGFNGGYKEPVVLCAVCGGSASRVYGPRAERLHRTVAGHELGRALLDEVERKAGYVARMMRMFTRRNDAAPRDADATREARRALLARLDVLRSDRAMED